MSKGFQPKKNRGRPRKNPGIDPKAISQLIADTFGRIGLQRMADYCTWEGAGAIIEYMTGHGWEYASGCEPQHQYWQVSFSLPWEDRMDGSRCVAVESITPNPRKPDNVPLLIAIAALCTFGPINPIQIAKTFGIEVEVPDEDWVNLRIGWDASAMIMEDINA